MAWNIARMILKSPREKMGEGLNCEYEHNKHSLPQFKPTP